MSNLTETAIKLIGEDPALAAEVHRLMIRNVVSGLTAVQQQLLAYIRSYMKDNDGIAPTLTDMAAYMGLASRSGVHRILNSLVERGAIRRIPNKTRAISITERAA